VLRWESHEAADTAIELFAEVPEGIAHHRGEVAEG
jgi:hypothetical protein